MRNRFVFLSLAFSLFAPAAAELHFDGSGNSLQVTFPATDVNPDWSLSLWIKPEDNASGYHTIFDSVSRQLSLWIDGPTGALSYQGSLLNGTSPATNGLTAFAWHHLAITRNGATLSTYVDGSLKQAVSNSQGYGTFSLFFGSNPSGGGTVFTGQYDDIRIYTRALDISEVEKLSSSRSRLAITGGLYGHWTLDDGVNGNTTNATAIDRSGNGNNGATASAEWRASSWINYP